MIARRSAPRLPEGPPRPRTSLTQRQREALDMLAQGLDLETIARRLGCSEKTVRNHLSDSYKRLGVHSAVPAVLRYLEVAVRPVTDLRAWSLPHCRACSVIFGGVEVVEGWERLQLWLEPCEEHEALLELASRPGVAQPGGAE